MDAAGKDSVIKHVITGLNPQGTRVTPFKHPNEDELYRPFLWRVSNVLPKRGHIAIFNRSHYEEVLICKVHPEILLNQKIPGADNLKEINKAFWKSRYEMINNFEDYLYRNGTIILKFFLNVSKEEQKKRFLERIDDPAKNWKFSFTDINERGYWDDYMKAYEDAFENTSVKHAPWYIIPADKKWFTRIAVGKIIVEHLEKLNLRFPQLPLKEREKLQEAKKKLETL
jgi:PPK2 family polyphosphate:nucleotide phosphotransferase